MKKNTPHSTIGSAVKRSYRLFAAGIIAIAVSACSFLDEQPLSGQPEESVITTKVTLFRQAVLSLYDHIGSNKDGEGIQGMYRGIYDLQTFASNEAIIPIRGGDWYDGGLWMDLHEYSWAADNECCENAWLYLYKLIGLCNHSLHLIDQHGELISNDEFITYSAEIRAVRAMAYMYLLDLFGRVPIVTKENIHVQDIYQSERSEVFDFVWSELQFARIYLPDERSNNRGTYYGRITRPVVCFMLMKLALNAEIWTDDNWTDGVRPNGKSIPLSCDEAGDKNAWEAVLYYGQQIISSQAGYALCNSQTECFKVYNEEAVENIFTIPMDPNIFRNRFKNLFRSLHYEHAAALGYGGENGSCATMETLDVFGYNNRKQLDCRFSVNFFSGVVHINGHPLVLSSGDTLIYYPREVKMNLTGSPYVSTAGARMHKYAYDPGGIFDGQLRNTDIVLFRLADVYLMIAEAQVRNGESGEDYFQQVRMREALALNLMQTHRDATLENIYYERWMELMWEGWHRQDQIRFGTYVADPNDHYLTVFPIPTNAIQTNSNLRQNYGYQ